jgi:hypothetical protein
MEEQLLEIAIGVLALAGGVYFAWKYRNEVREKVAQWLRNNGLGQSLLMDVWMSCDTLAGAVEKKIICKIFVKTQKTGEQKVYEQTLTLEQLKSIEPSVAAEVEKRGAARKSILNQFL